MSHREHLFWEWIQEGSYIYVCGDADEMAKDVNAALQQIAHEEARKFIKALRLEKGYLLDVY